MIYLESFDAFNNSLPYKIGDYIETAEHNIVEINDIVEYNYSTEKYGYVCINLGADEDDEDFVLYDYEILRKLEDWEIDALKYNL